VLGVFNTFFSGGLEPELLAYWGHFKGEGDSKEMAQVYQKSLHALEVAAAEGMPSHLQLQVPLLPHSPSRNAPQPEAWTQKPESHRSSLIAAIVARSLASLASSAAAAWLAISGGVALAWACG
jgi:hypothetical protein